MIMLSLGNLVFTFMYMGFSPGNNENNTSHDHGV